MGQVSGDDLQDRPVARLSQALQGQVGGLNITAGGSGGAPNATQSINVRGYTGLGTSGSPLVVIDGIQGGDINSINPEDVENITVLKDAASAAIYGSSAPYGVILITTKQGRINQKPTISYNDILSVSQPINLPTMLSSVEFANLYNEASLNAGAAPIFNKDAIDRMQQYIDGKITDETMADPAPGANNWYDWTGANANNDWFDIYFKDFVFDQQHNLSLNGGGEKSKYYIGVGYNDKQGMYRYGNDEYQRFNVRSNISTEIADWVEFSYRGAFSKELFETPNTYAGKTGGNYMHQIARKWPNVQLKNPDGNYSDPSDVLLHEDGGREKQVWDRATLTGEFRFKLAPGWTATVNYTYKGLFRDQNSHLKTVYTTRPNGEIQPIGGTYPNNFSRYNERVQDHTINIFSQYEKQLDDHYFSALAGYVQDYTGFQSYGASNSELYSDNVPSLNTTYGQSPNISDGIRKISTRGVFGRLNYNFKGKYLFELNGRYDGTSRFLEGVRWKFYPGVSAGWNVDQEEFFEPVQHVVNNFKLRASYGSLGDQSFLGENWYPFFPALGTISPNGSNWLFGGSQQAYVRPPGLVNLDLTWITSKQVNVGADFSFLDNRLSAVFDYYIRKATDFAGPAEQLPAILGQTPPNKNNAAMETRGFELSLGWRDKIGEVSYGLRAILSDYKGKVTKYPNPTGSLSTWREGQEMGEIWGYVTHGLFQSDQEIADAPSQNKISGSQWTVGDVRYQDIDGDGEISFGSNTVSNPGDRTIIGNNTPRYQYSFALDLNWKNFDASFFLQGVGKRDAWVGSNYFWGIVGDQWQSSPFSAHKDRWTESNPNGYFPKFYLSNQNDKNTQTQTRYLQNASYLRMKNIQLGYTLPTAAVDRIKFSKIRVFASVENAFTITNLFKTVDPELFFSDAKIYPLQRVFSAGVNLSF